MNYEIQLGELYRHIRNQYYYVYVYDVEGSENSWGGMVVKTIRIVQEQPLDNDIVEFPVHQLLNNFRVVGD